MFESLYNSADILVSFFYNLMYLDYDMFFNFLRGTYEFEFVTLINDINISLVVPNIPIIDIVFDTIVNIVGVLFLPLEFLEHNPWGMTPFYLCFISFLIRGLFILGIIKLISFLIELMPFE